MQRFQTRCPSGIWDTTLLIQRDFLKFILGMKLPHFLLHRVPVSHKGQQAQCSRFGQRQRYSLVDARPPSVNVEGGPRQATTIACHQPLLAFIFIRTENVLKTRLYSFQKCCYCYELITVFMDFFWNNHSC